MLKLNGIEVKLDHFPDGTLLLRAKPQEVAIFQWKFESNEEFVALQFLVMHLRDRGTKTFILDMSYIPNARQDRVKVEEDVLTLKYFAKIINDLHFDKVFVLDAHSSVSGAVFDRLSITGVDVLKIIKIVVERVKPEVIFFPDEGSMKRYTETFIGQSEFEGIEYAHGEKKRNWTNGKIEGYKVITDIDYSNKKVLIIDDISSYGGTFYYAAQELRKIGAGAMYLYVTHCEDSILNEEKGILIKSGLLSGIYTTDSLFEGENPLITVIDSHEAYNISIEG